MKETGKMEKNLEKELSNMQTEKFMKETGIKGLCMGKEYTHLQMEQFIKETGNLENDLEKEL